MANNIEEAKWFSDFWKLAGVNFEGEGWTKTKMQMLIIAMAIEGIPTSGRVIETEDGEMIELEVKTVSYADNAFRVQFNFDTYGGEKVITYCDAEVVPF